MGGVLIASIALTLLFFAAAKSGGNNNLSLEKIVNIGFSGSNIDAFLSMIRSAEGTSGITGYNTLFGGGLFFSYEDHPRQKIPFKNTYSTAAGAYQILAGTWDEIKKAINLPDFSPQSQDRAAIYLINKAGALNDVESGNIQSAIQKTSKIWASFPGAGYGQQERAMTWMIEKYVSAGGRMS